MPRIRSYLSCSAAGVNHFEGCRESVWGWHGLVEGILGKQGQYSWISDHFGDTRYTALTFDRQVSTLFSIHLRSQAEVLECANQQDDHVLYRSRAFKSDQVLDQTEHLRNLDQLVSQGGGREQQ